MIGILAAVAIPSFVNSQRYVDEQEEILYDELTKLEVTPNGTPLDAEISTEKVEVDSVTLNNPSQRNDKDGDPSQKFIGWKNDNNDVSKNVSFENSTVRY